MATHLNVIASQEDLRFVRAEKQDFDRILRFLLDYFRPYEPVAQAVGLTEEETNCEALIPGTLRVSLANPLSLIVLNEKDEVVAANLTYIAERENANSNSNVEDNSEELKGGAAKMSNFLEHMESGYWDLVPPHCNKLAKIGIISVRNDETRKGIANKMINIDLDNWKKLGCDGILTVSTAFYSQNLFLKNGYKILKEVKHEDWCDKNGKRIIFCPDKTDRALLVYKNLI